MNEYIVAIKHYFWGYENFIVEAENKSSALEKAKEKAARYSGNYDISNAKVIRKCKK